MRPNSGGKAANTQIEPRRVTKILLRLVCGRNESRAPACMPCGKLTEAQSEFDSLENEPLFVRPPVKNVFEACARRALAAETRQYYRHLGGWLSEKQLPVVYSKKYNITFAGLEHFHPLDAHKFKNVLRALRVKGLVNIRRVVRPESASDQLLHLVHSSQYLNNIRHTWKLVKLTEILPLAVVPNAILQEAILKPLKHHACGTVLAVGLALERGWAINLGGGMHHASHNKAAGWCAFSDITLAIKVVRKATRGQIRKILVIDLDAHQGNGYQRDKMHFKDEDLVVLDVFNCQKFPKDGEAEKAIDVPIPVKCGINDQEYLSKLEEGLSKVSKGPRPDFLLYNAGADILQGDKNGQLNVSPEALAHRDQMVFKLALSLGVPICMLLSGGYSKKAASVVADSIQNLFEKFDLK